MHGRLTFSLKRPAVVETVRTVQIKKKKRKEKENRLLEGQIPKSLQQNRVFM